MFEHLKVGDRVQRQMGAGGPLLTMVVVHVDDALVYCDLDHRPLLGLPLKEHWQFDRATGAEEDPELGWGRSYRVTGTFLVHSG